MKRLLLITVLALATPAYAGDISASYSNSNFEEEFYVDRLDSIEMWDQPRTQYTPKNLRTEQQMRFSGKEGTNSYNSYTLHLTDYDTKITKSYLKDGKFYVEDNTGQAFQTGVLQEIDTSSLEAGIQTNADNITNLQNNLNNTNVQVNKNTTNISTLNTKLNETNTQVNNNSIAIQNNTKAIQNNTTNIKRIDSQVQTNTANIQNVSRAVQQTNGNVQALSNGLQNLDRKVDATINGLHKLNNRLEQGLATVSALAGLHPNPRHQGKTQVSVSAGMYADNVAGAVGIFHYVNDRVMLSAGASYGGSNSFAGNVGITIGF